MIFKPLPMAFQAEFSFFAFDTWIRFGISQYEVGKNLLAQT